MAPRSDVYFDRGKQHAVCQDYGAVGADGTVCLADGCSDSPDSDIGARLICQAALRAPAGARDGQEVALRARKVLDAASLPCRALDATLLLLTQESGGVVAQVWGDGAVLCRKRDGTVVAHEIFCDGSAPPYLSYLASPDRLACYAQQGYGGLDVHRWGDPEADSTRHERKTARDVAEGLVFRFYGDYESVMVLTDGYRTGTDSAGSPVDPHEVLLEMSRLKCGELPVRRRYRSMLWAKLWTFGDDFGAAGMTFFE